VLGDVTTASPVQVEINSPAHHERVQLVLRLVLSVVLGWVGITGGWLTCVLYGALPLVAAIAISSTGSEGYAREVGPRLWRVLAWLVELSAFMLMLTDRFPTGSDDTVRIELRVTCRPTVGTALARLATSIPSGLVLLVLGVVSAVLWVIGAVIVVLGGTLPDGVLGFQRGIVRWQARLLAYHAALTDEYPPFTLDTGDDHRGAQIATSEAP
jgi:Domain of unknown function (DUF4389)